ncbi:MAG: SDR family NAD(P)-dependent oxidoreductase [Promethearchaeota archaeon]
MLKDKIALVTGASRGIGRAISIQLAQYGAHVAINCRQSKEEAKAVCRVIEKLGRKVLLVMGDTCQEEDVETIFNQIEESLGKPNILVNNAAYALCKPFLEYSVDEWKNQLFYKGLGYYLTARRALPSMIQRKDGVIINILSTTAQRDGAGELAYATTNGAATALTRGLASEFGKFGIRVNGIMIMWADNAFDSKNADHVKWLDRFALERVTKIEEVAEVVSFLASPKASGITGTLVPVDAGFLCR